MSDETTPEDRVAGLERQLAEAQAAHRQALLRAALRAEAVRAGIVDLDGLKLADTSTLQPDENGEVPGAPALIAALRRAKPWLFGGTATAGGSSSSTAAAPPAQPPKPRRAIDMTHEEWQAARAELLRRL